MYRKQSYGYGGPVPRQSMQAGALVGGLLGAGKNLIGQLTDDKKGVNLGQVAKSGLAGAAGTIPGVGGMAANMIQGAGQQQPAAPGAQPANAGGVPGFLPQAGLLGALGNAAQNFIGQSVGGGIPLNPEAAGAPYKMRGVRLMKQGGAMFPEGVISAQGGNQTPDPVGTLPASDFRLHLRDGEREYYRVNPEGGFSYVGPQSEVMNLIDPDQKLTFFREVLGYEPGDDPNTWQPIGMDKLKAEQLQKEQDIAFGEELASDPMYRSAIRRDASEMAKTGAPYDPRTMSRADRAFVNVLPGLREQPATGGGRQAAGGRAPVRVTNGYGG